MRHAKKRKQMGRTAAHRNATLNNMSVALIRHKRIITTLSKAKVLRPYLEPIITKAKDNTMHARRIVFSKLKDKDAVKELFGPIMVAVGDRPGGYLRIVRMGFRKGDGAQMALIEFVDYNETYDLKDGREPGQKRTRRGRGRTRRGGGSNVASAAASASTKTQEEE